MRMNLYILIAVLGLFVMGCVTVGEDYKPPEAKSSWEWHSRLDNPIVAEMDAPDRLKNWWMVFKDEKLNSLVQMAMEGNLDVKSAHYALAASRATLKATTTDRYPTLDASGSGRRTIYGDSSLKDRQVDAYTMGLDASWEIDIFGGTTRSIETATADMEATQEAMHDVMVSLLAEIATNYINVRSIQNRMKIVREDIRIQEVLSELADRRFQLGLGDASDVQRAAYGLEYAKTKEFDLRTSMERAANRLAVLTGRQPGALHEMLFEDGEVPIFRWRS